MILLDAALGLHDGIVGSTAKSLVKAFFSYLTSWVSDGAAALVLAVGHALSVTSEPLLGAPLASLMVKTTAAAAALSLPLLL
ncbi:MAG TPA: hypothetical protein VKT18_03020, partial [Acidimicrobiales bacterium]|nr:hypothetical protein [Acidimicrobiales bacterium]